MKEIRKIIRNIIQEKFSPMKNLSYEDRVLKIYNKMPQQAKDIVDDLIFDNSKESKMRAKEELNQLGFDIDFDMFGNVERLSII